MVSPAYRIDTFLKSDSMGIIFPGQSHGYGRRRVRFSPFGNSGAPVDGKQTGPFRPPQWVQTIFFSRVLFLFPLLPVKATNSPRFPSSVSPGRTPLRRQGRPLGARRVPVAHLVRLGHTLAHLLDSLRPLLTCRSNFFCHFGNLPRNLHGLYEGFPCGQRQIVSSLAVSAGLFSQGWKWFLKKRKTISTIFFEFFRYHSKA